MKSVLIFPALLFWMMHTPSRQVATGETQPTEKYDVLQRDQAAARYWGQETTEAMRAWRITSGARTVIVAVIDTGIDIQHPDLKANIWTNPGESGIDRNGRKKESNGVDDDRNGYIDDVNGWNFAAHSPDVSDRHGHGTHIAGIIGADGVAGRGVRGVCPQVTLMPLKYIEPAGESGNPVANTVAAIRYATRMGAHIINYSAGGPAPSDEEQAAIREAGEKGVLLIAAAGNEKSNSDRLPYYPADYDLNNILSVTAFDQKRVLLPSANYGAQTVDLAAPGKDIYSTLPGGRYGQLTGTSQATAFASGVAALAMAKYGLQRRPEHLVSTLTLTGDVDTRLIGKTKYKTRLNAYRALTIEGRGVSATGVITEPSSDGSSTWGELATLLDGLNSLKTQSSSELRQAPNRRPAGHSADASNRDESTQHSPPIKTLDQH
ncbi:MAG: S8 family serine peptidase [Bdellovibrionaceae bacterium]|nr:S8 family serine peptidase [Pseudobdellovibrionaceae bacterium]